MGGNEYMIAEYLVRHGDEIVDDLRKEAGPILPLHREAYLDAVYTEIILHLIEVLNLDYEEVSSIVTEDFLDRYVDWRSK